MPFVKDDPNINKLDTLPEKFTKEFVDYVCHLYANNTSVLKMSEILNTPQNTIKKYLSNGVVFYVGKGKTKGKKFYFSTYCEDRAIILATEYVTQMKKLITEERTRLEQLKESMYGVC